MVDALDSKFGFGLLDIVGKWFIIRQIHKSELLYNMKSRTRRHKSVTKSRTRFGASITKRSTYGTWTYRTQVAGKDRYFPLGHDKAAALELADQIKAHLITHPFQEVLKMFHRKAFSKIKEPIPTVQEFWQKYEDAAVANGLSPLTVKDYKDAFKSVYRKVLKTKKVDDVLCDKFDFHFWMEYKRMKLEGLTDHTKIASCMRTINSKLIKVCALFKRPKVFDGMDISWADEIKDLEKFGGLKQQYKLPSADLIEKTFKLWENSSGDMYTLLGLILHFGLRRKEAFHARAEWFEMTDDFARMRIERELDFMPKGGHEGFTQGNKAIAANILNKASGDVYLIKNRADYGRAAFKPIIAALREIGWERSKPLHECRKLFGSYITATKSIYISQKFLRHSTVETTNESYSDIIVDPKILNFWAA